VVLLESSEMLEDEEEIIEGSAGKERSESWISFLRRSFLYVGIKLLNPTGEQGVGLRVPPRVARPPRREEGTSLQTHSTFSPCRGLALSAGLWVNHALQPSVQHTICHTAQEGFHDNSSVHIGEFTALLLSTRSVSNIILTLSQKP